jgi:hypothetical protein
MEDSESAKKQENTGIGPASACCGESAFTGVSHALWVEVVASPSCAGLTRASIFFAKRFLPRWMDCRVKPGNDSGVAICSTCMPLGRNQQVYKIATGAISIVSD